jgi:hypothetical protein
MATREVWIEHKRSLRTSYCGFSDPNGDMRAAARRNMRFSYYSLLGAGLVVLTTLAFYRIAPLRDLPFRERVTDTGALVALGFFVLQIVAQSNVKVEYRGNDGLVCVVRDDRFSFSRPSSFRVEIPKSDLHIALSFPLRGDFTAKISGENALSGKQRRARGLVVRPRPLHMDFKDRAGRTAALDQSPEQRRAYRLVYDDELTPEWLLFIVVATFLLR